MIHQNVIARIYLRGTIIYFHNNNIINPVINKINLQNNQKQIPLRYFGIVWEMISFNSKSQSAKPKQDRFDTNQICLATVATP